MTTTDMAVTVRGLRKSYGNREVVCGIDLDVHVGEVVGLIGANGAGKTTTVECIQGLCEPNAGTLRVLGFDPTSESERLRPLIGSQLQDSALPDRLRVSEAVKLFTRPGDEGGDALLERFGLGEKRKSAFASMSGGERQRLFLVLALLGQPRLVILDELTQGLDPSARREVWNAVKQLRDSGTTVLLVTHELDEAEALCDRVVAMRAGHILDSGSPAELVDRYGRRATVRFSVADEPHSLLLVETLRTLPGVERVTLEPGCVSVQGDRAAIAHVGAALVQAGDVPADLSVEIPTLEEALVELLDNADRESRHDDAPASETVTDDLIGAIR